MDGFPDVLADFLSNGETVLAYHVPSILCQLYRLAAIIHGLNRYRFYAASLLFIYDGDGEVQETYKASEAANPETWGPNAPGTARVGELSEDPAGEDEDAPGGLKVAKSWEAPPAAPTPRPRAHSSEMPTPLRPSPHLLHSHSHSHSPTSSSCRPSKRHHKVPGAVTIRLIDFAHCTTGDDFVLPSDDVDEDDVDGRVVATFPPTHPNQPDLGFLLGLKSLCAALRMIWAREEGGDGRALRVHGEEVFEDIFGDGALKQGLGEGPGPEG